MCFLKILSLKKTKPATGLVATTWAHYLSSTKAIPPDMPAAKFLPVGPRTTAKPPVMYSQP